MESLFSRRVLTARGMPRRRSASPRGFTLIEMLVVLVIIVIITAIALSGQSTFSRTEALNNAAFDIGLSIRQAESYGLSNSLDTADTSLFLNVPYGIALTLSSPTTKYVLFRDSYPTAVSKCHTYYKPDCAAGNGKYDPGASPPEAVTTYALNNGFTFGAFCATSVTLSGSVTHCSTDADALTKLAITFSRPNDQATIAGLDDNGWRYDYTYACMQISSGAGDYRYASVSANGQVLVGLHTDVDPTNICP